MAKPSAILTADWHLRESVPECRIDDFEIEQWRKVRFVKDLQKKHNCLVLHSGDLFHHWKPSPSLLSKTIKNLPDNFFTVYGNHDLPQHSLSLLNKSGVHTVESANKLTVLDGTHYGEEPEEEHTMLFSPDRKVLIWHVMTWKDEQPYPGCTAPTALNLLKKYPYDLILTGDNHIPFIQKHKDRLLVNPGPLTRQQAGQVDYKPRVYLWYGGRNAVEEVYLPIKPGVVTREHIEKVKQRSDRIDAFIQRLDSDWKVELDFPTNLKNFIETNNITSLVTDIIYKAVDG